MNPMDGALRGGLSALPSAADPALPSAAAAVRVRYRLRLTELLARREWVPVAGYAFYVTLLTAGYYYNLTFVQLGLIDLGTNRLGMAGPSVG